MYNRDMKKQSYCSCGVLRGLKTSKALNTLTLRTLNLLKTPSGGNKAMGTKAVYPL